MSFDLFVFERREHIKTSEDVVHFLDEFTQYEEDKDYNSLLGCSEIISDWAKKMFEKFPPLNGEYAPPDEVAYATQDSEAHLTDYALGKHGVYCSFSYSVDEEALEYVISIADEYKVGIYNPQSNDAIHGKDLDVMMYRTESTGDVFCDWDNIETSIEKLDSPERGTSARDNAFITVWFEKNGKASEDYIQCSPNYKKSGFLKNIFAKQKQHEIQGYFFEVAKGGALYQTQVASKEELIALMKAWCIKRTIPDLTHYEKIM